MNKDFYMLSNLLHNAFKVLSHMSIAGVFAWSDSTVCLQWIQGQGRYKQFVANRVEKKTKRKKSFGNMYPVKRVQQISVAGEQ